MATTIPVTISGWYELTDGRVQRFDWRNGQLCEGALVANWTAVPEHTWADDGYTREYAEVQS